MKNVLWVLTLFILQIYLAFRGVVIFGKYLNPILFLFVSISIAFYYVFVRLKQENPNERVIRTSSNLVNQLTPLIWGILGIITAILFYGEIQKVFIRFSDPGKFSDVIPQVITLFNRYAEGEYPYTPIDFETYQLFPAYMPFHWLPVWFTEVFGLSIRWVAYIIFALSLGVYGAIVYGKNKINFIRILSITLPSLVIWAYILFSPIEIGVSFELTIVAYYIILAIGLISGNIFLIGAGIIMCLLSRYTLLFWLPLFATILWVNKKPNISYTLWGGILLALLGFYILPFYLEDPTIINKAISYYYGAAANEWIGYGTPLVSWTFERGVYFGPIYKKLFAGEMIQRVYDARLIQTIFMAVLCLGGIFIYLRYLRTKIRWNVFAFAMLYTIIISFFIVSPLTFQYYLMVPLVLSAIICGEILACLNFADSNGF